MKFGGINLHSYNSVVVVTDEQDRALEEKRVPNGGPLVAVSYTVKVVCLARPPRTTWAGGPHQAVHEKGALDDLRHTPALSSRDRTPLLPRVRHTPDWRRPRPRRTTHGGDQRPLP
jgi:hypothetical protein